MAAPTHAPSNALVNKDSLHFEAFGAFIFLFKEIEMPEKSTWTARGSPSYTHYNLLLAPHFIIDGEWDQYGINMHIFHPGGTGAGEVVLF